MKQGVFAVLIGLGALLLYLSPPPASAQPTLTELEPADGAVLAGPPPVVHMCFSERALHDDPEDFRFRVLMPEDKPLGLRIVFQPLTNCVDIHPGLPEKPPFGEWTLEWEVTGEQSGESASGTVKYQVAEGGSPVPSPSPRLQGTPRSGGSVTPTDSTPSSGGPEESGDGLATVWWILIIVGGSTIAVLGLVVAVLLLRRRRADGGEPPPLA